VELCLRNCLLGADVKLGQGIDLMYGSLSKKDKNSRDKLYFLFHSLHDNHNRWIRDLMVEIKNRRGFRLVNTSHLTSTHSGSQHG
jgi:hypothetical protein